MNKLIMITNDLALFLKEKYGERIPDQTLTIATYNPTSLNNRTQGTIHFTIHTLGDHSIITTEKYLGHSQQDHINEYRKKHTPTIDQLYSDLTSNHSTEVIGTIGF